MTVICHSGSRNELPLPQLGGLVKLCENYLGLTMIESNWSLFERGMH
jgi:hypothetical protein